MVLVVKNGINVHEGYSLVVLGMLCSQKGILFHPDLYEEKE